MSSHSNVVSRASSIAAMVYLMDFLARRCINAARPLRVGWPPEVIHRSSRAKCSKQLTRIKIKVEQLDDVSIPTIYQVRPRSKTPLKSWNVCEKPDHRRCHIESL